MGRVGLPHDRGKETSPVTGPLSTVFAVSVRRATAAPVSRVLSAAHATGLPFFLARPSPVGSLPAARAPTRRWSGEPRGGRTGRCPAGFVAVPEPRLGPGRRYLLDFVCGARTFPATPRHARQPGAAVGNPRKPNRPGAASRSLALRRRRGPRTTPPRPPPPAGVPSARRFRSVTGREAGHAGCRQQGVPGGPGS